jgi:hypothetical protein
MVKEKLFDLILFGGVTKALINYDTEISRVQIKDATFKDSFLIRDVDLVNCTISGIIENCNLWSCKVEKSHLDNCELISSNKVYDSKITKTEMGDRTLIDNCYIENGSRTINGTIKGCIIRSGQISDRSKMDDRTEVIRIKRKIKKYS